MNSAAPRVRTRFVASARYFLNEREHLDRLADTVQRWNHNFPTLGFAERGLPPSTPLQPGQPYPLPAGLQAALKDVDSKTHNLSQPMQTDPLLVSALLVWGAEVMDISLRFWPPVLFPPWTGPSTLPAAAFISACLVYEPRFIEPEDWFLQLGAQPRPASFDPFEERFHPIAMFERFRHNVFTDHLREILSRGDAITAEDLDRAEVVAVLQAARASSPIMPTTPAAPAAHMSFFAGISTRDYREAEQSVLEEVSQQTNMLNDLLRAAAHFLHEDGRSITEIAGRLGVDRSTVRRWLGKRDPGPHITLPR